MISTLLVCVGIGSIMAMNSRSFHTLRATRQTAAASQILQERVESMREKPWAEIASSDALVRLMNRPTAIHDLVANTTGATPGTWTGWKQENDGIIGPVLASTFDVLDSLLSLLGRPAPASEPIFLDNVKIAGVAESEVDVQLWALRPAGKTRNWFRIRAMATAALPPTAYQAPDRLELALRRFNLREKRARVRADDVGLPSTIQLPNVTRAIEVLVEPVPAFELALWTDGAITLPCNGTWVADSYDSRDPAKSDNGFYPGKTSDKTQAEAVIASNLARHARRSGDPGRRRLGRLPRSSRRPTGCHGEGFRAREHRLPRQLDQRR